MTALKIDMVASLAHYAAHLQPIWDALPDHARGEIRLGADTGHTPPRNHVCMVASWRDMAPLRGLTRFIYVEHGAGQSYAGDPKSAHWPDYSAGGARHMDVLAYICPSERVAKLWNHPHAFAVGCPRLDAWINNPLPVLRRSVCLSFHWPCKVSPESDTAFEHYRFGLPAIIDRWAADGWEVYYHVHPKWEGALDEPLTRAGAVFANNADALSCAVFVADNTSGMYEAAALGRTVLALNCPSYRRDIHHGLRFWDVIPGLQADEPEHLLATNLDELVADWRSNALGADAAHAVYAHLDGSSAQRSADAILSVID